MVTDQFDEEVASEAGGFDVRVVVARLGPPGGQVFVGDRAEQRLGRGRALHEAAVQLERRNFRCC